MSPSMI